MIACSLERAWFSLSGLHRVWGYNWNKVGLFWPFLLLYLSGERERWSAFGEIQLWNNLSWLSLSRPQGTLHYFCCPKYWKQNAGKLMCCGGVHIGKDTASEIKENVSRRNTYVRRKINHLLNSFLSDSMNAVDPVVPCVIFLLHFMF